MNDKELALLHLMMGYEFVSELARHDVTDGGVNPDGTVRVTDYNGTRVVGRLEPERVDAIIRLVASCSGRVVTEEETSLNAVLPGGERFQGLVPPEVPAPTISIRKHSRRVWSLEELVEMGALSPRARGFIEECLEERLTIIVSGTTGSGKTTLLAAILRSDELLEERIVLAEDTPELRCGAEDVVPILTGPHRTLAQAVSDAMRLNFDRLVIGEVRDEAAMDMLAALVTGHTGYSTLHANTPEEALLRLEGFCLKVVPTVPRHTIASAIDVIVQMGRERNVVGIARLRGLDVGGNYLLEDVLI